MIDAARRSGMSVSELVRALAEGSPAADPRDPAPRRRRADPEPERLDRRERGADRYDHGRDDPADIDRQLDVLADRLRGLSAGGATPPRARARSRDRSGDATLEEIAAQVDRLSRQIPEPAPKRATKTREQTDVAAVLAALDGLDRRVKAMSEERTTARPRRSATSTGRSPRSRSASPRSSGRSGRAARRARPTSNGISASSPTRSSSCAPATSATRRRP